MEISCKLTVFFEGPFWVGIFERSFMDYYEVARVIFGDEPLDSEVYEFILTNSNNIKFCSTTLDEFQKPKKINPKRLHRMVKKEVSDTGIGTKAQIAIKLHQESNKVEKKKKSKELNEAEIQRKFLLKQQKKKEKRKGH